MLKINKCKHSKLFFIKYFHNNKRLNFSTNMLNHIYSVGDCLNRLSCEQTQIHGNS